MPTRLYEHLDPTAQATCNLGAKFQVFQTGYEPLKVCDNCGKAVKLAPPTPPMVGSSEELDPLRRAAWLYGNKAFDLPKEPPGANAPPNNPNLPTTGTNGPLIS